MANVFAHVQTTYEHINVFSLLHRSAAVDLNTSNVQKSYNAYQHQSQSQMLQICTVHCRSICLSTDARNMYNSSFNYMTVTHTNYRTYTFHELISPTTESYNMIRYEHLPDHVVLIALRRYQKFQCRINLFQLQQKLPNVQI